MIVRIVLMFLCLFVCCQMIPNIITTSTAGDRAIEQLLEILEKRGDISKQEANSVREAIGEEEQEFSRKKQELDAKERDLLEQERVLREREAALNKKVDIIEKKKEMPETGLEASIQSPKKEVDTSEPKKHPFSPLETRYEDGFCITTPDEKMYSLCIGGLLQVDYRYFNYENEDPGNNGFDLRRVRLLLKGSMLRYFDYKFEYEFQGAGGRRLLDAYADAHLLQDINFRIGQFKTPYGFEWLTKDKNLPFTERSMGVFLTPFRGVGLMAYGSPWQDTVNYRIGIFNSNGLDDSTRGDEDSLEWVGRLVVSPFKHWKYPALKSLQLGGSFSYGHIDRTDVHATVLTTGLTPFFDVASSAKFNIIRDADTRTRYGAEFAWTCASILMSGEYYQLDFNDVTTSSDQFDVSLDDYYISLLWMITGEKPTLRNGILMPIKPLKNLRQGGGWGAFGLAFRYDVFNADASVYDNLVQAGESVREAKATTLSLNWFLNPYVKFLLDYTRTKFDQPLLIARDPLNGTSIYSELEDVIITRFQFAF